MKMRSKKLVLTAYLITVSVLCVFYVYISKQEPLLEDRKYLLQERDQYRNETEACEGRANEAEAALSNERVKLTELERKVAEARTMQEILRQKLEKYSPLYNLQLGKVASYYDVARFKDGEMQGKVTSTVTKWVLGPLFGGGAMASQRENIDTAYSNRASLNRGMMDLLESPIHAFSISRIIYDGKFECYQALADAESDEECLRAMEVLKQLGENWENELLEEEKKNLLYWLATYRYQLRLYYDVYAVLLVNTDYLEGLNSQIAVADELLHIYDPDGIYGYTQEEKEVILMDTMDLYQEVMDCMITVIMNEPAFPALGRTDGDRRGYYRAYHTAGQKKVYIREAESNLKMYFDSSGNLMEIYANDGKAYFYEGELAVHTFSDDESAAKMTKHCMFMYENFDQYSDFN